MQVARSWFKSGMNLINHPNQVCEGCLHGKQTKMSFPKDSSSRVQNSLEIIHTVVCSPIKPRSLGKSKYLFKKNMGVLFGGEIKRVWELKKVWIPCWEGKCPCGPNHYNQLRIRVHFKQIPEVLWRQWHSETTDSAKTPLIKWISREKEYENP